MRRIALLVAGFMFGALGFAAPALAAPVCTTHAVYVFGYPHLTHAWTTPASSVPLHKFRYGIRQANGSILYVTHNWLPSYDTFPGHAVSVSAWEGPNFCGTVL